MLCYALGLKQYDDNIRFEVFKAVTVKNAVFWYAMPCGSCKNQVVLLSVIQLLVIANIVPSLPILSTLMMEAICYVPWFLQEPHGVTS
jgi:hypothetical protein